MIQAKYENKIRITDDNDGLTIWQIICRVCAVFLAIVFSVTAIWSTSMLLALDTSCSQHPVCNLNAECRFGPCNKSRVWATCRPCDPSI